MNKTVKFAKENKKAIIIGSAIVVAIVLFFVFRKKIKALLYKGKNKEDSETSTGTNLTPGLNLDQLCVDILEACSGIGAFKTDEEAIYTALSSIRTAADWQYMQNNWSNVMSELSTWNGIISRGVFGLRATLTATLSHELSKKELQKCREILIGKGITPDF